MSVNIEDILLLKAQQDAANKNNDLGLALGAISGSALGVLDQAGRHSRGQEQLLQKLADRTKPPLATPEPGALNRVRPGARMAGGLVGAILGGALGAGTSQLMQRESQAARLLAKLQTEGNLNPTEAQQLENVLTETYNSIAR